MSEIVLLLAVAENGVIGKDGAIPWRISDDLKRFKALTLGKTVVMGRKTCDSLPKKPLPAMAAPHLSFRMPAGQSAGYSEIIRPQSGMILLYPAWQTRGERRYDGDGARMTIEFDLAV